MDSTLIHLAGPTSPEVDLVVYPAAGAGPSYYHTWREFAPPGWRLRAVCLPGRGPRFGEPFAASVHEVADLVAEAAAADQRAPVVLFGHSGSSLWALETARRLAPALLATAGCQAPVPGRPIEYPEETDEANRIFTRQQLLALGITEQQVLTELVEVSVPILVADMALSQGWEAPDEPLCCPIVSYFGSDDAVPTDPWNAFTTATASIVTVPGDHNFTRHSPDALLADLSQRISAMLATSGRTS
jgi:surfactin synthase thioesterase subunit